MSNGYTFAMKVKDSGLRIRVDRDLRDRFQEICHAQDRPAAQVLREYMRRFIAEHEEANDTVRHSEPADRQAAHEDQKIKDEG